MPFDPTLPANGSAIRSAEPRHPFDARPSLMDAVPGPVRESAPVDLAGEPVEERWVGPNLVGHGVAGKRGRGC